METEKARTGGEKAVEDRADQLILSYERIEAFLAWQRERHRAESTIERYRTDLEKLYAWLPEDFSGKIPQWLTELYFGDFATRRGLEEKNRELLIVVILAALGDAETQLKSHGAGAIKAGNTTEEIICALSQAMPYMGFPRFFNALNCLQHIVGTSAKKSVLEP